MQFKDTILIMDMDGTLLTSNGDQAYVSEVTESTINTFIDKGGTFSVATGRSQASVMDIVKNLHINFPLTLTNGAITINHQTKKIMQNKKVNQMFYKHLLQYFDVKQNMALVLIDGVKVHGLNGQIEAKSAHGFSWKPIAREAAINLEIYKIGVITLEKDLATIKKDIQALPGSEDVNIIKALPYFIEIMDSTANKASSIEFAKQEMDLTDKKTICVGDQMNDATMLEYADYPIVPANGNIKLKKKYHTLKTNYNENIVLEIMDYIKSL